MRDPELIERAKAMRKEMTEPEKRLWLELRARRFVAAKFRRQVVIGRYIADFACRIPRMLVIEVDGDTHASQAGYDVARTAFLQIQGYDVLRFTNHEVTTNLDGVLHVIHSALQLPLSPALSPEGEREKGSLCPKC